MRLRHARWLLSMALVVACGAGAAPAPDPVDELMHKSGLWKQIGEFEATVQAGISQSQGEKRTLDEDALRSLRRAAAVGYAPEPMRATMRRHIAAGLSADDIGAVMTWLDGDLGKRITAIEEKASEPAEALKLAEGGKRALEEAGAPRKALIERMVTVTHAADYNASILINTTVAVMRGVELASPEQSTTIDSAALIARLRERKPALVEAMKADAAASFAGLYAQLSDAELERYVQFAQSPAGLKYHDVTFGAVEVALTEGAEEMGRQLTLLARKSAPRTRT